MSELSDRIAAFFATTPRHLALNGAAPAVRPYLVAGLSMELEVPALVVTATNEEAEVFCEELNFFLPSDERALLFPAWEVLPFEPMSPSPEISAERLATLAELLRSRRPVVVAPLEAVLQFLIPKGKLATAGLELRRGKTYSWRRLFRHFSESGYRQASSVEVLGEFSRRGGILDFFPPGLPAPVRVEFFGDEVESLRLFDPQTQRSAGDLEGVEVLPVREILLDGNVLGKLKAHLPSPAGDGERDLPREAAECQGLEHYQAILTGSRQTLLDYLPSEPLVIMSEYTDLEGRGEKFRQEQWQEAERALFPELFAPERAYLDFPAWTGGLGDASVLYLDSFGLAPQTAETLRTDTAGGRNFVLSGRGEGSKATPLEATVGQIRARQREECVLLVAGSEEAAGRLRDLCTEHGLGVRELSPGDVPSFLGDPRPGAPHITWGRLKEGFHLPGEGILVVTEEDIFGAKVRRQVPRPSKRAFMADFHLLKAGDFLVHVEHGIGLYNGLTRIEVGGEKKDFLVVSYLGGDKVYVPAEEMDVVQRYVSWEGHQPRIDKLGGKMWPATKRKAKKALVTLARDLLRLYAVRQSTPGHAFPADTPWQAEFEMGFEYTETEDQLRAIEEVKKDMERPHPMDRLVCGDVGYGKTEVAMRAAFKAVMDSRQVALLAPTTILVEQHLSTFRKRFAPYPVRVEILSRFVKASERKRVVEDLAAGEVDILIGTHRLLGRDVRFRDLGLVIVDEEQRFGVRHKERLKEFRETVDVLSLTATPIPRTLYLSLSGIRELSQITTAPEDRLAIRNTVSRFDAGMIREAVLREIRRGGQVFFIHNRVQTIGGIGSYLQRLLPEVRIGIAHGQMGGGALEKVMARFRAGEFELLLCTTIVESGLDIPNANTMIVNRADTFGLAELYQLRGRIGRSRHRAYAYFLVPEGGARSPAARKRIEVIRDFAHLGAGFQIALYDLEIRGSGSVLGYRQSGHIAAIGFDLYTRLLQETIREIQGEPVVQERPARISLALPTFIPEEYVESINHRLTFYKKVADAASETELEAVADELRERFGPLPEPVTQLLWAAGLKRHAEKLGMKSLEWRGDGLLIAFYPQAPVAAEKIVAALEGAPPGSRMTGEDRIFLGWSSAQPSERFGESLALLRSLQ